MKLPIFARGSTEKIANAIQKQVLTYPSYILNTDTDQYGFLDDQGTITYFKGNNKKQVVKCEDTLPPLENGDQEVLYILGSTVYSFNGEEYIPIFHELEIELYLLTERVGAAETTIGNLQTNLAGIAERLSENEENIDLVKNQVQSYDGSITEINIRMDEVEEGFNTVKTQVDLLNERVDTHRGRLDTIDVALQGMDSRLDTIESHDESYGINISNLQTRMSDAETNISSLQTASANHENRIQTMDSAISHLTGEMYDLNVKVDNIEIGSGGTIDVDGQPVPIKEYVDGRTDSVLAAAKAYTDSEFQWRNL